MEEKRYDPYTGEEIKEPVQEFESQEENDIQRETEVQSEPEAEEVQSQTASSDTIVVGESGYYYQQNQQANYGYQGGQTGGPAYQSQEEPLRTIMQRSLLCWVSWRSHWPAAVFRYHLSLASLRSYYSVFPRNTWERKTARLWQV